MTDAAHAALQLHQPHLSIPLDIVEGVPWAPGTESHPASIQEQADGLRWWCDECRCDAPCRTYLALTS